MQPFVRSAIDAARRGESDKALVLCKQALDANPRDVEAWLVVAAVVNQPERKRQCLDRVLSIDPTNQIARDALLQMDRTAMASAPTGVVVPQRVPTSQLASAPRSPLASLPALAPAAATLQAQAQAAVPAFPSDSPVKSLTLGLGRAESMSIYVCAAFLSIVGLLMAWQVNSAYLLFLLVAFLMILLTLSSQKVEITEAGIRASRGLFGTFEVKWKDIKGINSGQDKDLRLFKNDGQSVQISKHLNDYPRIIEIIRQKRPDLFNLMDLSKD